MGALKRACWVLLAVCAASLAWSLWPGPSSFCFRSALAGVQNVSHIDTDVIAAVRNVADLWKPTLSSTQQQNLACAIAGGVVEGECDTSLIVPVYVGEDEGILFQRAVANVMFQIVRDGYIPYYWCTACDFEFFHKDVLPGYSGMKEMDWERSPSGTSPAQYAVLVTSDAAVDRGVDLVPVWQYLGRWVPEIRLVYYGANISAAFPVGGSVGILTEMGTVVKVIRVLEHFGIGRPGEYDVGLPASTNRLECIKSRHLWLIPSIFADWLAGTKTANSESNSVVVLTARLLSALELGALAQLQQSGHVSSVVVVSLGVDQLPSGVSVDIVQFSGAEQLHKLARTARVVVFDPHFPEVLVHTLAPEVSAAGAGVLASSALHGRLVRSTSPGFCSLA